VPTVAWAEELRLRSLADVDNVLTLPLGEMPDAVMEDQTVRSIRTCKDILAILKLKFTLSPDNRISWDSLESESVRCLALDVLKTAKPASSSFLGGFHFSAATVFRLPVRFALVFSDDQEKLLVKAEAACTSWAKYDPSLRVRVKGEEGTVTTDGWTGRIVQYARGDLDGDGIEDLMFLREGEVTGGTAALSTLFIVTQTSAKSCLRVIRTLPESLGMGPPREATVAQPRARALSGSKRPIQR
jgi:hypothetical protein